MEIDPEHALEIAAIGRGKTKMVHSWDSGMKLHVDFNMYDRPIVPGSVTLATQMGMMARDGNRLSLTFKE